MVLPILFLLVNAQKKPSKLGSIPMIQALFPMTKEEPCSFPLVVFAFSSAVSLSDCLDSVSYTHLYYNGDHKERRLGDKKRIS